MIVDLTETNSSEIAGALVKARRYAGSPAMGMVGTLVVVADEASHHDALKAATEAGREHPSRVLLVIPRPGRGTGWLDAEVRIGEGTPGEAVILRLHGELAKHAQSVVLPLLLPDSPVMVWWPGGGPKVPAEDKLGALGKRRVTDAAATRRSAVDFPARAAGYQPGDTDFAWTRLTPWRALLAAALDQYPAKISTASVTSVRGNTSADLLAAWLECRLRIPVELKTSRGPGITAVRLHTSSGEQIALTRSDGRIATYIIPGQPDRPVALKRRTSAELLSEELRRLDPDDLYARTLTSLVDREAAQAAAKSASRSARTTPGAASTNSARTTPGAASARTARTTPGAASTNSRRTTPGAASRGKDSAPARTSTASARKSTASARKSTASARKGAASGRKGKAKGS